MNQPTFGDELRRLRRQRGLSLKKFAQMVHYDPGYLSKIENGLKPPTDAVAGKCDAVLEADGMLSALVPAPAESGPSRVAHEVRIPVVIDGRPMLLPIKPAGQLSVITGGDHDRVTHTDVGEVLSRGLPGSSAVMVVRGADVAWQWELSGGRAFGGAVLPVQLGEASWSTQYAAVIADQWLRPLNEFVSSAPRGVVIASTLSEFACPRGTHAGHI